MDKSKSTFKCFPFFFASLWSLILLFAGICKESIVTSFLLKALSSIYIGYEHSLQGAIVGSLLGFIDALIGGFLCLFFFKVISKKNLTTPKSVD
ncbi:hypothetical protein COB11_02155 [Candidatus Aerophobetes bacterium]|uniref:Uncharacterized protein n=1 Tax=Aerophobetes bacterium TaxID=2030807 RepID=A0A2A4YLH1_UNCAE|nr:MAG: hypothetical protein COB11_02155 [Candidatus Aerophobetes bacterium]